MSKFFSHHRDKSSSSSYAPGGGGDKDFHPPPPPEKGGKGKDDPFSFVTKREEAGDAPAYTPSSGSKFLSSKMDSG